MSTPSMSNATLGSAEPDNTWRAELAVSLAGNPGMALILWSVGMFCILGWDWLTNLPREVKRVWKPKFTHISWLYLATRYYGIAVNAINIVLITRPITGHLTPYQCLQTHLWQSISTLTIIQLTHIVLGLRVYALYEKSRYVAVGLLTIMLAGLGIQLRTMTITLPIPDLPGVFVPCMAIGPEQWLVAFWGMPALYYLLVFALALNKALLLWRKGTHSHILQALFREGVTYFFGIFLMTFISVMLFITQDANLQLINLPATLMLNVTLACRLILNLRAPDDESLTPRTSKSGLAGLTGMGDKVEGKKPNLLPYGTTNQKFNLKHFLERPVNLGTQNLWWLELREQEE